MWRGLGKYWEKYLFLMNVSVLNVLNHSATKGFIIHLISRIRVFVERVNLSIDFHRLDEDNDPNLVSFENIMSMINAGDESFTRAEIVEELIGLYNAGRVQFRRGDTDVVLRW
jgi:hypothetical protein